MGLNPFILWTKELNPTLKIGAIYKNSLSFSEFGVQPWQDQGRTGRSLSAPNVRIDSSTLSRENTVRLVCTPRIPVGASLEGGVTSPMRRIPKACSWRLTVFAGGYAASDEEGLPQILTLPLRTMRMVATGLGLGLLPVSFFRTTKTVTMNRGVRVHHTKVWAMTL